MASEVVPSGENFRIAVIEIMKLKMGDRIEMTQLEEWFGFEVSEAEYNWQLMRLRSELRNEHGRCLSRIKGEAAYTVATDEQMVNEHEKRAVKHVFSAAERASVISAAVDKTKLSPTTKIRHEHQKRQIGFIRSMMGRMNRKIAEQEHKKLGAGEEDA